MELHAYPHLRDSRRDNDLFVILSWSPKGAFLGSSSQAHTLLHLVVIMFLILGYPFDLWVLFSCGHGWLGLHTWWWMIWCHLVFQPITHSMPYWGIFLFWLGFVNLHWFAWSSPFTRYTPSWWFAFILSWFSSGAFLESFNQAHAFWYCCDSWMKLS